MNAMALLAAMTLSVVSASPLDSVTTYEQYLQLLQDANARANAALGTIDSFEACADTSTRVDSLDSLAADYMGQTAHYDSLADSVRTELEAIDMRIAMVIREKYDILGITEQDVIDAENEIASIRQELELLLGLTPQELEARSSDLDQLENRIDALNAKPVSYFWRVRDLIAEVERMLERARDNLP